MENNEKPIDRAWMKLVGLLAVSFTFCFVSSTVVNNRKKDTPEKIIKVVEYRESSWSVTTRSLNTSYQLSPGRSAMVCYSIEIASSLTLSGGQSGSVTLQISPDNSTWTTIATQTNNNTGTLTIGLNTLNTQAAVLAGFVPSGYYEKIVSSGTSTFTYKNGMEVLL